MNSIDHSIASFIRQNVLDRFLRYVRIHTASAYGEYAGDAGPSTECQWDLLRLLERELQESGLQDILLDEHGYLYATLPACISGASSEPFCLLAHIDTSPDQPGENVVPRLVENYDGSAITYPDDKSIVLNPADSPELSNFTGDTIITASGRTLLGADDKAGIAEIMTALEVLLRFRSLPHGEIRICFTRDEEIGRGVSGIDLTRLPQACYTVDGGGPGELECECFDAWKVRLDFRGRGVHPGYAFGQMVNAAAAAGYFVSLLPRDESPEHTKDRKGFYHLVSLHGDVEIAYVEILLRDFEEKENRRRTEYIREQMQAVKAVFPGIVIEEKIDHTYSNMREVLERHPEVRNRARAAVEETGLAVIEKPIRGGTDGSRLCELGHPTPNLFAGGYMFHSKREWIARGSLELAVKAIVNLAGKYCSGPA